MRLNKYTVRVGRKVDLIDLELLRDSLPNQHFGSRSSEKEAMKHGPHDYIKSGIDNPHSQDNEKESWSNLRA